MTKRHNSSSDPNQNVDERIDAASKFRIPAKNVQNTPEEIAHRVGGSFVTLPDTRPSAFRQISPEATGESIIDQLPFTVSGVSKFGGDGYLYVGKRARPGRKK